jgi:hypothetical protein
MSTDLDVLAHSLGRIRDYSSGLTQPERKTIQSAIDVLPSVDKALDASFPTLTTIDALLTLLLDPAKYKRALADLTSMVREAKASREQAQQAAADLKREQATIAPELASARAAHERSLADKTADFDKRVSEYQKSLSVRQAALDSREQILAASEATAGKLRAELQEKLDRIRSVAA